MLREGALRRSASASWSAPTLVPFTAQTRMSGVDLDGRSRPQGRGRLGAALGRGAGRRLSRTSSATIVDAIAGAGRHAARRRRVDGADGSRLPPRALGVIHLKDIVKPGIAERFAELRRMGIRTVMITGDNPLTAAAIAQEAGVDDFLAEATPEDKMALIKSEQAGGRLVAMTGDGTNDAPALAQADVGVAMNTGTQAAKEAGNMVDLDSDPTKLIEIVEIGKQLLITRGSLTTFSIANDVAKYFAIIPAMFAGVASPSVLDDLNVMDLQSPRSAILSAVIFNALIIVALIPLALRGVKFVPIGAAQLLRRNLLIYGARRHHRPVHRHQAHRHRHHRPGSEVMRRQLVPPSSRWSSSPWSSASSTRSSSPAIGQVAFHDKADGSLIERDGKVVGSSLIGQAFTDSGRPAPEYFHSRPSAAAGVDGTTDAGYDPTLSSGSNLGPDQPRLPRRRSSSGSTPTATRTASPTDVAVPVDAVTASGSGLDPAHLGRQRPAPGTRASPTSAGSRRRHGARSSSTTTPTGRALGFLGEPGVNVLELNLALDRRSSKSDTVGSIG